jgi:ABC-2 type transport system ATP-binding protein
MSAAADGFAIDVRNVTKSFSGRIVVNNISLQVARGEVYGFLGPNGSGKTTFIRMLCGLLTPDHAEGSCLGYDITRESGLIKKSVGYMTQKFSFYEDLTVRENFNLVAGLYGVPDKRAAVERAVDGNGFRGRENQLAGTLSGGWKQRLALAACTLHSPKLLLLDEPTAGVDPKARRDFWELIHKLAEEDGVTSLVSTHYMDEAERCHRLAYIAYGDLLVTGPVKEVTEGSGLHTWVVEGRGLQTLASDIKALGGPEQTVVFGSVLHVSSPDEAGLDALAEKFKDRPGVKWTKSKPGLEDVFIYLGEKKSRDNFK